MGCSKLYKLIIVDDEEIIRNGLAEIIDWKSIGYEVVGCFEDGKNLIEYLKNNPVDVIMTDIMMDNVSGLDICKFVYENFSDIKVVILSGYKEFEYAAYALKYNVNHYLIKPTDFDEVCQVFTKLKEKLDKEKTNENALVHLKERYSELVSIFQEQFFTDIIMGAIRDTEEIKKRMLLLNLSWDPDKTGCSIIECVIHDYQFYIEKRFKYGRDKFNTAMRNFIQNKKDGIEYFTIPSNNHKIIVIALYSINKSNPNKKINLLLEKNFTFIKNSITSFAGLQIDFSIKDSFNSIFEMTGYIKPFQICNESEICANNIGLGSDEYNHLINKYKLFMSNINDGNSVALKNLTQSLIYEISELPLETIHRILFDLIVMLTRKLEVMEGSFEDVIHGTVNFLDILNIKDINHMRNWLTQVLEQISLQYQKQKDERIDPIVIQAQQYMNENFSRDLSIEEVADYVFLSPSYLGRLFKKHVGESFSDYLTRLRIQKAIEFLKENKYKVYEISKMVGYNNSKYFYRVFKHFTGSTPKEYLRM